VGASRSEGTSLNARNLQILPFLVNLVGLTPNEYKQKAGEASAPFVKRWLRLSLLLVYCADRKRQTVTITYEAYRYPNDITKGS